MGCSGTDFNIVEISSVWSRYARRTTHLPSKGVDEALGIAKRRASITLDGPDGLLILALTPGVNGLELQVLLAVSTGTPGAFRRQEASVCAIARDLGASAIVFNPARRGWSRLLGPEWSRRGSAYVRQLNVRQEQRHPRDSTAGCDGTESYAADGGLQGPLVASAEADVKPDHGASG